jgi:hypothetical protein
MKKYLKHPLALYLIAGTIVAVAIPGIDYLPPPPWSWQTDILLLPAAVIGGVASFLIWERVR